MIPECDSGGNLPLGEHRATTVEVKERFGKGRKRQKITATLADLVGLARAFGAKRIYVNGSYVTSKLVPGDADVIVLFPSDSDLDAERWRFRNRSDYKRDL